MSKFDVSDEATKVTELADNAARKGLVIGQNPLRAELECELQRLRPEELRATLDLMKGQKHFSDITLFGGSDKLTNAIWFTEADGSAVVAELRDMDTDKPQDSCPAKLSS